VKDFEIVIVEDPPFDRTKQIVEIFKDKRIKYFRNEKWLGLSKSRNKCIELAKGTYVFFTDSDCFVPKNWIEQGLKLFTKSQYIGVEGKTYYVSEKYEPTYSDDIIENKTGGQFHTCNIAYKKNVLEKIGGFDERFTYMEDRDLALRALKIGKICFNPKMVVYHKRRVMKPVQFVKRGKRIRNRVMLLKKHGDKTFFSVGRIVSPTYFMAIIFPPLIFASLFRNNYRTKKDFMLFPFNYPKLIYERLNLWYICIKEKILLI
jgi:GT2 family glycosyltransferase